MKLNTYSQIPNMKRKDSHTYLTKTKTTHERKQSTILKYVNNKLNLVNSTNTSNNSKKLSKDCFSKSYGSKSSGGLSKQSTAKTSNTKFNSPFSHNNTFTNINDCSKFVLYSKPFINQSNNIKDINRLREENAYLTKELEQYQLRIFQLENQIKNSIIEDKPINKFLCPKPMQRATQHININEDNNLNENSNVQWSYNDWRYLDSINELTLNDDL